MAPAEQPKKHTGHELDAPPWLRVEATLMAIARNIRKAYDVRFAEIDLNLSEASLLALVAERGPLSQSALADMINLGRAATGASVDALEARGAIERLPHPEDRRIRLVSVTAAGKELLSEVTKIDEVLRSELRAGIPREDRQQLTTLLQRLGSNIVDALSDSDSD